MAYIWIYQTLDFSPQKRCENLSASEAGITDEVVMSRVQRKIIDARDSTRAVLLRSIVGCPCGRLKK